MPIISANLDPNSLEVISRLRDLGLIKSRSEFVENAIRNKIADEKKNAEKYDDFLAMDFSELKNHTQNLKI